MFYDYIVIFFISLMCICLELFFTRILCLKAWNHVVYVIIPFAILGYGIGANICLIFRNKICGIKKNKLIATLLFLLAISNILVALFLIYKPIYLEYLINYFADINSAINLSVTYIVTIIPFVIIGFLVVYLFSENREYVNKLYFCDLCGAGIGAIVFFLLINTLQVVRSLIFLSIISFSLSILIAWSNKRLIAVAIFLICFVLVLFLPEPINYNIDRAKGWEWIPGFFNKHQYELIVSKWCPLGRTDAYRFKDEMVRDKIYNSYIGTFEINVVPTPEFSYFCTNFLSGTPVYKLSEYGLREYNAMVKPFSQAMEFPYSILNEPKVVIIGTGGGRDIFIAKTHNAKQIIGAEINPVIYSEMSKGGSFYEYSGKVYGINGVNISNIDGRYLVKKLESNYFDLIVLNGVDTFSALSTGAYAYAESYLYTKNALIDYLRILNKNGMINFNRWLFKIPRETLRLFVIAIDALRSSGVKEPWEHIIIGHHAGWGMMLVKKTPFSLKEKTIINKYFQAHNTELIFPSLAWGNQNKDGLNMFDLYAKAVIENKEKSFIDLYPFDISVVYDDNPFFYKYYKLKDFNPKKILITNHPVTGTVIFLTQLLVLINAAVFIIIFIILPLFIFKKDVIRVALKNSFSSFIIFFSCLGVGFMFIEISMMQRFTLLLGSPIYSISITLAALLIFSGLGSILLQYLKRRIKRADIILISVSLILTLFLIFIVYFGTEILNCFIGMPFIWRIVIVCLTLLPVGLCLGMFFPCGLQIISLEYKDMIAWAWGINCGFTVLGSMLAIILAQFYGFNLILLIASVFYLIAALSFSHLRRKQFLTK